ncbi:MAG TPA: hypothetical protein VGR24_03100 [bacterium]|jgi:hypothetical protein|nr:hypothetical protein [bacterium]
MNEERPSVLIISNGHGEDAVGAALARRLEAAAHTVMAYPLVGTGRNYGRIPMLEPVRELPSGGFGARGTGLVADLRAGGLGLVRRQRRTLRAERGRYDLVVAIGDAFCLWMAAATGPAMFIGTAKSSRHDPYSWLDVRIIRGLAAHVFARDEDTAAALRARGIDAAYVGNPLMDTIGSAGSGIVRRPDRHVVVLLPGSRQEAYVNLENLLRLAGVVTQRAPVDWWCALAPTLDRTKAEAMSPDVNFSTDFGGTVGSADVVVSLAGTASEQAAGLGKPVVAFPGSGPQFTPQFLALQQKLLGDALVSAPTWTEAAAAVLRLLADPEERLRRGAAGRLRMGPPGAIERIAGEILKGLKAQTDKRANGQAHSN